MIDQGILIIEILSMKTGLIIGASGQVGQALLQLALQDPEIIRVVAPSRRPLPPHPKLKNPIVDFDKLPEDAPWWQADFALCTLGTTLRQAKSKPGFYRVDHDYILATAELAYRAGTPAFGLVSSLGANPTSRIFYLRVKGEVEQDISTLGFDSLTIARPSLLIGGPRSRRLLEGVGLFIGKYMAALLPRKYRAVSTLQVARALLDSGLSKQAGVYIIESEELPD